MTPGRASYEVLSSLINRLLALDPETLEQLAAFEGDRVEVEVAGPDGDTALRLWIRFGDQGITIAEPQESEDGESRRGRVVISGPPLALIGIMTNQRSNQPIPPEVSISGDVAVAQRLQSVLRRLRIDWEELLAPYLGDVGAHEFSRHARSTWRWGSQAVESLLQDSVEFLVEEVRLLPERHDVQTHSDAVDDLRDDVERLQQRVERMLRQTMEPRS